jgi:hypothetical protein
MHTDKNNRKTWQYPWRYKESFLIVLELMLLGFIFEVLTKGRGFPVIQWPANLLTGLLLIIIITLIHILFRRHPIIKWLSSIPAAISAISFFTFLVFLLGFIPQGNPHVHPVIRTLGLYHIKNNWVFMVSSIYLLTSLGLVIFRRLTQLNRRNIGFLLNHAGMWIVLAAAGLGSGDIKRMTIELNEESQFMNVAADQSGMVHELPFSMKLIDFRIDEYRPKIGIVDRNTGELVSYDGFVYIPAEEGNKTEFDKWTIMIIRFIEDAITDSARYISSDAEGAAPAVFVEIRNKINNKVIEEWLSCGSYLVPAKYIQLDNQNIMVMLNPEAERFVSDIVVDSGRKRDTIAIEVNKPFKIKGYNIYQVSYDSRKGKWSETSILEVVKDPWLTVVYIGIFMLLAGAAYIFWIGNEQTKKAK